jgi:arsenate reductase
MIDSNQDQLPPYRFKVLFLCSDNAASSIMAEAILRRWGAGEFRAFSGGVKAAPRIDPTAIATLETQRVWKSDFAPKSYSQFLAADAPRMDFVISVGEHQPPGIPANWPGGAKVIHWHITDPLRETNPQLRELSFRRAFLELENRIKLFVLVHQRETSKSAARAA